MKKFMDDDAKENLGMKSKACVFCRSRGIARSFFSAVFLVFFLILSVAAPQDARAAGLGKITVFSMLGQPLRAEVEIMATREELVNMSAQLAPEDAFKQMGLDYALILSKIEFEVTRRSSGQAIIKLITKSPVNDPFVDMLLELSWPSGRLVREYTFLLDPQEVVAKKSETPATQVANVPRTAAPIQLASASPDSVSTDSSSRISGDTRARALGNTSTDGVRTPSVSSPAVSSDRRTVQVRDGDTLYRIARNVQPEGVSLDKVLIGLFRANRDAFDGQNMNRLKSGRILTVPEREELDKLPQREAKRVFVAQSSNWNAYQSRLAAAAAQMPAQEGQSRQGAVGRITARVEDGAAPATDRKDRVRVSRARSGGRQREEDRVARDQAARDANDRIAALETSVANLQKLLTLKDQSLAELQDRLSKQPASAQGAPTAQGAPAPQPAPTAQPAPVASAQQAAPAPNAQAAPQPAPPQAQPPRPAPPRPRPVIPPPPPEEPGILDILFDNLFLIGGGIGALALLGGGAYFFLRWYRKRKEEDIPLDSIMTMTDDTEELGSQSVFQDMGGQSVDTSRSPQSRSGMSDFSQANPGSIDTEEVDVIAEAEMYMTFNRDAQAEEVLLEAKQKDPTRHDIHLKLLEIYSRRNDLRQFEALAVELFSETGGTGEDWEKAAAMGARLDPTNALFSDGQGASSAGAPPPQAETVVMPGEFSQMAKTALTQKAPEPTDTSIDFNIGSSAPMNPPPMAPMAPPPPVNPTPVPPPQMAPVAPQLSLEATDIAPIASSSRINPVSFETTKIAPIASQPAPAPQPPKAPAASPSSFSMSALDLDLKAPELEISGIQDTKSDSLSDSFVRPRDPAKEALDFSQDSSASANEEVNTKLDLAKAYQDMGDVDGARELLLEVIQEGDAAQKGKAQSLIEQLGA